MGASVFHGAVMRSPLPAWQWQSMIMREAPLGLRRGVRTAQPRAGRRQEPDAGGDAAEEVSQAELLVRRVDAIVRQSESHEDGGNPQAFVERVHHRNGSAGTRKHRWRSKPSAV